MAAHRLRPRPDLRRTRRPERAVLRLRAGPGAHRRHAPQQPVLHAVRATGQAAVGPALGGGRGVPPGHGRDPGMGVGRGGQTIRPGLGDGLPPPDRGSDAVRDPGRVRPAPGPARLGDRPGDVPVGGVPELSLRRSGRGVPRGDGGGHRAGRRRVRELAPQGIRARRRADGGGRRGRPARRRRRQTRGRSSPRPVRVPHGDPGGGGVGGSRARDPGDRRGRRTRDGVRLARRVAPGDDRRRGGAGRGRRLRRPRVPARHAVRRGERAVRLRARARASEPATRSRGGRGAAARPGRRDRHPARAGQRGRVDRSRSAAPARATGGPGLAGRAGRPAARQAGGDAHPAARARRAQVGLRRHHEPRAPHAAHGRTRVRGRAPPPTRRALRRGGPGVPDDHPRPDGPVDPPGRGPPAHLPDRGRQAHVHAAPGEHGQPAHRGVPGTG